MNSRQCVPRLPGSHELQTMCATAARKSWTPDNVCHGCRKSLSPANVCNGCPEVIKSSQCVQRLPGRHELQLTCAKAARKWVPVQLCLRWLIVYCFPLHQYSWRCITITSDGLRMVPSYNHWEKRNFYTCYCTGSRVYAFSTEGPWCLLHQARKRFSKSPACPKFTFTSMLLEL
jgi:hypothetical protein